MLWSPWVSPPEEKAVSPIVGQILGRKSAGNQDAARLKA
jgi:hypothetical protein